MRVSNYARGEHQAEEEEEAKEALKTCGDRGGEGGREAETYGLRRLQVVRGVSKSCLQNSHNFQVNVFLLMP